MRSAPDLSIFARGSTPLPVVSTAGGGGPDRARIVCCFLRLDVRPYDPLLAALPAVIQIPAGDAHASGWLGTLP